MLLCLEVFHIPNGKYINAVLRDAVRDYFLSILRDSSMDFYLVISGCRSLSLWLDFHYRHCTGCLLVK